MVLSIISAVAGTLIALGSLALLWQQKIYIDIQTEKVTKIDLPFGIKLQTNAPVIVLFVLSLALILIPVLKQRQQTVVALKGHVKTHEPLKVYAIAAEQETNSDVLLQVPGDAYYTILYLPREGATAFDSESVDLVKHHPAPFPLRELQVPEILSAKAGTVPTTPIHTEAPNVVDQFK